MMKTTILNYALTTNATDAIANHTKFAMPSKETLEKAGITKRDLTDLCGQIKRAKARHANLATQKALFAPLATLCGLDKESDNETITAILTANIAVYRNGQKETKESRDIRKAERKDGIDETAMSTKAYESSFVSNISDETFTKAFVQVIAYCLANQAEIIYNAQTAQEEKRNLALQKQIDNYKAKAEKLTAKGYKVTEKATVDNFYNYKAQIKALYAQSVIDDEKAKASETESK